MPQLSDRFSAYPVTVRLDGSGNGTVRFQAQGANIVITNLYVAVATTTAQAKCTIYKGQVAAANAIATTNSGSTGAQAGGKIELLDGEAVFVVWTGGDASAIATATFSGNQIPFNTAPTSGGTDFQFTDPFAAGDGSIIFPALKSPNYVPGVSGWSINRDGTVEFGSGTFRGDVSIINPSTGRAVFITAAGGFGGSIQLRPPTAVTVSQNAGIAAATNGSVGDKYGQLQLTPPVVGTHFYPTLSLISESETGANPAQVVIDERLTVQKEIFNSTDDHFYMRGEQGPAVVSVVAATSATLAVVFTNPFPSGFIPVISVNITSGSGTITRWGAKGINPTENGFTILVYRGDAADPAITFDIPVQWRATISEGS